MANEEMQGGSQDALTGRMEGVEKQLIAQAVSDKSFRERLVSDPKAVMAEQGLSIPDDVQIKVLEENSSSYFLVLPAYEAPSTTSGELSDAELESVAGGTLDSQDHDWTGCASGRSGCVASNGCDTAVSVLQTITQVASAALSAALK